MAQARFRVRVGASGAIEEGAPVVVHAFERSIALVRHRGRLYALEDACPHRGAPLHRGEVEEGRLVCPLHGWAFDLDTGRTPDGRCAVRTFRATETGGAVFLEAESGEDA